MRRTAVLSGVLAASALVLVVIPSGTEAWAEGESPDPASRALEPAGYGYGEVVLMVGLLAPGLVLVVLWERTQRELAPSRVLFTPWGAEDVLFAVATYFLGLLVALALLRVFRSADIPVWIPSMAAVLSGTLTCLVVLFLVNRRYGLLPVDVGLRFDRWGHDLVLAAGMLLFVLAIRVPLTGVLHCLYERAGERFVPQFVVQQMLQERSTWGLAAMVVMALAVAPVWEETVFRGFVQPFLRRRLGGAGAMVATAVLFSLIHDPLSKFLAVPVVVLPLALALGYCYERTQRLAACILLHMLHNLVAVVAVLAHRGGA